MWILSSFVERDLPTETGYSTVVSRSSARALHPRRGVRGGWRSSSTVRSARQAFRANFGYAAARFHSSRSVGVFTSAIDPHTFISIQLEGRGTAMSANDDRDPLFRYDDPVFADERLLEITHLPGPDRIVGRDEQMQRVADALNPAVFGSEPNHLFIFGKTGTGKSLISRSVTQRVITEAQHDDVTVKYAFIDCGEQNTEASIVKTIAQIVNDPDSSGVTVPDRGWEPATTTSVSGSPSTTAPTSPSLSSTRSTCSRTTRSSANSRGPAKPTNLGLEHRYHRHLEQDRFPRPPLRTRQVEPLAGRTRLLTVRRESARRDPRETPRCVPRWRPFG